MINGKKVIIVICLIISFASVTTVLLPSLLEYRCKIRDFDDFEGKITSDIMNSNIVIVEHEEKTESEGVVHSTYGVGASGVVFKQDKDVYYALTAYHVVKNYSNAEYFIIPYGAPTYSEYREQSEVHVPNEEYYGQFEKATVVFADEKYDLAVISFKSEKPMNILSIEKENPVYKEKLAVISNPMGERFVTTYGIIKSKEYYSFESDDELIATKTFKHNAYIDSGSSGSAVLNKNMNIRTI